MANDIAGEVATKGGHKGFVGSIVDNVHHYFLDGSWTNDVINLGENIILALVIYVVGAWIARKVVALLDKFLAVRGFDVALRGFLHALLSITLRLTVALIAVEQLGVDTTSLLALFGAAGLAVGLALKDSLSNFASGVMLILMRPFKIGDFIDAAGTSGAVNKITIFNTILKTGDNREVIIPNSQIYGGTVTNYSSQPERRIDLTIGISYDDDIRKARDIILQIIAADERVIKELDPVVAVGELADSSVNMVVRCWVKNENYWNVRWHLLETIKTTFDENSITIPYPQRDVHLHNVNAD